MYMKTHKLCGTADYWKIWNFITLRCEWKCDHWEDSSLWRRDSLIESIPREITTSNLDEITAGLNFREWLDVYTRLRWGFVYRINGLMEHFRLRSLSLVGSEVGLEVHGGFSNEQEFIGRNFLGYSTGGCF